MSSRTTTEIGSSDSDSPRTLELLKQIQAGTLSPKSLATRARRQIVAVLMCDGYSAAETAQVLQVSDRTIERDKQAIREGNALPHDPRLVEEIVGQLMTEAELVVQRIRRVVRGKDAPHALKVDAEHRCFQIRDRLAATLQSLGYLPTAAQKVEASLTHQTTEIPSFEQIDSELARLITIHHEQSSGDRIETPQKLLEFKNEISRAKLAAEVQAASEEVAGDDQ